MPPSAAKQAPRVRTLRPAAPVAPVEEFFSPDSLAKRLDMSRWTIYGLISSGEMAPVLKVSSRCVRIPASTVAAWIASRLSHGHPAPANAAYFFREGRA